MPSMPYVVTQGDICTALENAFNFGHPLSGAPRSAAQTKLDTLNDLRMDVSVGLCGSILTNEIANHIDTHWFGLPSPPANLPTGWWINWSGPAEDIARQGIIRALEVSLGLHPGEALADCTMARSNYPVRFSWICPVPRFEFWIGWRDFSAIYQGDRDGVVNITMATPGYGDFADENAAAGIPAYQPMIAELDPRVPDSSYPSNGHIVVGSESTQTQVWSYDIPGGGALPDNPWQIVLGVGSTASSNVVTHEPGPVDGISSNGLPNPVVTQ